MQAGTNAATLSRVKGKEQIMATTVKTAAYEAPVGLVAQSI